MTTQQINQALEAITSLDTAAALAPLTRQEHVKVQLAGMFLTGLIKKEGESKMEVMHPPQTC